MDFNYSQIRIFKLSPRVTRQHIYHDYLPPFVDVDQKLTKFTVVFMY